MWIQSFYLYVQLKWWVCYSFTSRAFPTWQVFVRDQLEASNTITLPPPTDTQSWPATTKKQTHTRSARTHTHRHALYQLFLSILSQTQLPMFTLLSHEKCLYHLKPLWGNISKSEVFFQRQTPPRPILTVSCFHGCSTNTNTNTQRQLVSKLDVKSEGNRQQRECRGGGNRQ